MDPSFDAFRSLVDASCSYLVTGGGGFIGSHLVEVLLAGGARVRVVDDFSTGRRENLRGLKGDLVVVEGDITDPDVCRAAVEGVRIVFHQAALPSVPRSLRDPLRSHEVNATGTLNLLLAARDAGVQRFVYAGSSSAYGDTPSLPKREDQIPNPRSPYAVSKLAGEHYVRVFAGVFGLEGVVLRYFNVFGPRQDPESPYAAVIPKFIRAALDGRPPVIDGDGQQTRDFTYVSNVVYANLLAARAPAERVSGEVFNVGCGDRVSILSLWRMVSRLAGASPEAVHGPPRPGDVRDSLADLARARERMGFEVLVPLEEGVRHTLAWFRNI